jgi:hypothetical protein
MVSASQAAQPNWMTPLITVTPRLEQEFRYDQYDQKNGTGSQGNGQRLINYGGPGGARVELIPSYDWEVILAPPPYVTASGPKGTAAGFGDWPAFLVKYRLAYGNAEHGDYIVTAFFQMTDALGTDGKISTNVTTAQPTRIMQRSELGSLVGKGMQNVEQVTSRACQPIEAGHDQQVAALQPLHDLGQLGPISAGTGDLLPVDLGASGGHQFRVLRGQGLTVCRDPRIARKLPYQPPDFCGQHMQFYSCGFSKSIFYCKTSKICRICHSPRRTGVCGKSATDPNR